MFLVIDKYVVRPEQRPQYHPKGHQGTTVRLLIGKETVGAQYMEVLLGTSEGEGVTEFHSHEVEQANFMVKGKAHLEVDGEGQTIEAGDIAFFPPGKVHRITPMGIPYKVLVIYAPQRKTS